MSNCPLLVIVLGSPGSGKTTLARRIAQEFRLPLVTKDDIKESLFDSLGWHDREWSKKLGRAVFALLYYFMEAQLAAGRSLIVECNFDNENATPRFRALQDQHKFEPFQIFCHAPDEILTRRFRSRWTSGTRHPGHVDDQIDSDQLSAILKRYQEPLNLGGTIIKIDTTDLDHIDYSPLFRELALALDHVA
ncbi:MAG: ATP-binding protein [Chloroflexi bacterium]|nr:ATP-binding protein [Chloroflexota bacterium]